MSNYQRKTKNPHIGEFELATWEDDHFGSHKYAVIFPNGKIYNADDWEWEFKE